MAKPTPSITDLLFPAGTNIAGMILDQAGKPKFNMLNPAKYKDELTLSDADIGTEIQMLRQKGLKSGSKALSDIKQGTASGRLPQGVANVGRADIVGNVNETVNQLVPSLKREQRASYSNFVNMTNDYLQNKLNFQQGQHDRTLSGFGNLAQTALLWQSGFLTPGG